MDKIVTGLKDFNVSISIPNLSEAVIDEKNRNVLIKVIEQGWSENGNYYDNKVIESFTGHLLEKKKMYSNHLRTQNQADYIGRDMRDWSAQISESNYKDGSTFAKIHVFESEEWLFERIRKYPEEVGISIDARAVIREGTVEGRTGRIVQEIIKFNSADFVLNAAAKGKVLRLVAGMPDDLDVEDPNIIYEAIKSMGEYVNSEYKKFSRLTDGFYSYLWYLMGQLDRSNVSEEDMKKALSKGFNDFKKEMLDLDFAKVYMYEAIQEHGKDKIDEILKELFESKDGKQVTENNINKVKIEESETEMDMNQLKKDNPELVKQLEDEFKVKFVKEAEKDGEVTKVKEENKNLKETAKTVDTEMVKLRKENDEFKVAEKVVEKGKLVDKKLEESKIGKDYITDEFRATLMGLTETDDIDKNIKDREDLVLKLSGKIKDVGEPKNKDTKEIKDPDAKDEGISDEKAEEIIGL